MYDFVIVGAGLTGSICAYELHKKGYKVIIIEKRNHIGGNCYTEKWLNDIDIHIYGPHIFFTNEKKIWDYMNHFDTFVPFINNVKAEYEDKEYTLPFNLTTIQEVYGENKHINISNKEYENIEDYAINELGEELYEILIKGYTEKQWGLKCNEIPPEIIKRIPIRMNYDDNYYDAKYQGIPLNGYTHIFNEMLRDVPIILNTNFKNIEKEIHYTNLIYTGSIDEFYDYCYGVLPYRSLDFAHTIRNGTYQTTAVRNYTKFEIPYTRSIEHKHFLNKKNSQTVVSFEFPSNFDNANERFYPINTKINNTLYKKYYSLKTPQTYFLGRLGAYKYLNMSDAIKEAIAFCKKF